MAEVLAVHGIQQQQRGPTQLRAAWEPAFRDGARIAGGEGVRVPSIDLAFYGDLFLSASAQGKRVTPPSEGKGSAMKGTAGAEYVTEVAALESVSDQELAFLDQAADEATADRPDLGAPMGTPRLPDLLRPLARKLTRRFDGGLALTFLATLRQVKLYLEDDELAARIRESVVSAVGSDTKVLLAHSLGTVVAFDTLSLNPQLELDMLITVGSPLGMKAVHSRLRAPSDTRGVLPELPRTVRRWVNIYDPRDPVAAAGEVSRLWPEATDYTVDNEDEPHDIARYLGKRVTGRAVLDGTST